MGLDFYIEATMQEFDRSVDFTPDYRYHPETIAYWRKDLEVFEYFKTLYLSRGGRIPNFCSNPCIITYADMEGLVDLLRKRDNSEESQELCDKLLDAVSNYSTVYCWASF